MTQYLKHYDVTEIGFRERTSQRNSQPDQGENPIQFVARLYKYIY